MSKKSEKSDKDNKTVINFKTYLSKDNPLTGKLYFGPISHEVDEGFESAIKAIEKKISEAIDNQSVLGQLWTKNGFNYNASIKDLHNSLTLISKAQATLDTLDAQRGYDEIPSTMRFMNTPPGYLEEPDPDKSQRQGVTQQKLPEFAADSIDDRMIQMLDLMMFVEK